MTPAGSFPRIPYKEAMLKYGSDKPDLRNPILIADVGGHFTGSGFGLFAKIVEGGGIVRAIPAPGTAEKSRKFFDDMNEWARGEGFAGLGYATRKAGEWGGPIAKNHGTEGMDTLADELGLGPDDGIFFAAGKEAEAARLAGLARTRVGEQLGLIDRGRASTSAGSSTSRCSNIMTSRRRSTSATTPSRCRRASWKRWRPRTRSTSSPGNMTSSATAWSCQSGAIRNHRPDIMYKAFEIAGYTREEVDTNFSGMINAFKYRRPAARRLGAGHRPHRHAARRRAQHPRGRALPDEPEGRGSDDERPGGRRWPSS